MVVWKHAFGSNQRRLKKVALLGSDSILVSKSDIKSRAGLGRALSGNEVGIELRKVLAVQLGPLGDAHRRNMTNIAREELCFSILTADRSLDIEALTETDLEDWVFWLQNRFPKHQEWAGLPLYNETSLHCALENMKTGSNLPPRAFVYDASYARRLREEERQFNMLLERDRQDSLGFGPEFGDNTHNAYNAHNNAQMQSISPVKYAPTLTPMSPRPVDAGSQADVVMYAPVAYGGGGGGGGGIGAGGPSLLPASPYNASPQSVVRARGAGGSEVAGSPGSNAQRHVVDIDCATLG